MLAKTIIKTGDTIVSLAAELLGDPLRYGELITLNKLRAPYIAPESAPGVLAPGDTLLYPPLGPAPRLVDPVGLEALTYKRDFHSEAKDLQYEESGAFATKVGRENLKGALTRRLTTLQGNHPFHPEYGSLLRTHLGKSADLARAQLIAVDARRALLADPRVLDARVEVSYDAYYGRFQVDALVTPVPPGSDLQLSVTI